MKNFFENNKKSIVLIGGSEILAVLFSLYFAPMIMIFLKTHSSVTNPSWYLSYIRLYGFPKGIFSVLFIAFSVLMLMGTIRYLKNTAGLDNERNFKYAKSGVYGTAHELEESGMKGIAVVQPINEAEGPIIGRLDNTDKKIVNMLPKTRINRHCLIFGASQSGKTWCYVLPFAMQAAKRRESLIVTDPKGELYETTAEYFRKQGYVVKKFDLKNPNLSDGWDCLKEIVNSKDMLPEDRAAIFSEIIIKNTQPPGGGSGGIFEDGPKLLLKALLLRAALDPALIEEGKTSPISGNHIGQCIEYINNPVGSTYLEDVVFNPSTVPPEAEACITTYNGFKQASANLYGNLVTGLVARLGVFDTNTVKTLMGSDDIDLTLPGKVPCVYYVIMSDMHSTYNFLGALFFSFLFLDLVEFADSQKDKRCPVPVNFLLDEFANIGSIPDFDKKMAVIRSRALYVSIILQDINQLMNKYPNTYKSIMSNCATHLCIGFNDLDTEKYYSERAGNITTTVSTEQHAAYESLFTFAHNHSQGAGRRSLYDTDELARMGQDECLVSWQGKNVKKILKFPADLHPDFKFMSTLTCKANDYPAITDPEAREAFRIKNEQQVATYNKWLEQNKGKEKDTNVRLRFVFDEYARIKKGELSDEEEAIDLDESDFVDACDSSDISKVKGQGTSDFPDEEAPPSIGDELPSFDNMNFGDDSQVGAEIGTNQEVDEELGF